jgi:hypothetical protein
MIHRVVLPPLARARERWQQRVSASVDETAALVVAARLARAARELAVDSRTVGATVATSSSGLTCSKRKTPRLLAAVPAVMGSDNPDTEVPRVRDGVRNLGAHGNRHEHALDRMSSAVLALRRAQIEVGTLRGGMVSGKGSIAPCFELPDGRVVPAGNSVGAFHDRGPRDQGLAGRPPRARSAVSELVIRVFGNRARAVAGQRTGTTAEGVNERVERIYAAVREPHERLDHLQADDVRLRRLWRANGARPAAVHRAARPARAVDHNPPEGVLRGLPESREMRRKTTLYEATRGDLAIDWVWQITGWRWVAGWLAYRRGKRRTGMW